MNVHITGKEKNRKKKSIQCKIVFLNIFFLSSTLDLSFLCHSQCHQRPLHTPLEFNSAFFFHFRSKFFRKNKVKKEGK